ncbi:MAG: hypothetical protein H0T73_04030, partial [Ardenticatenales bacterium]|nr:hypothetical protein [Ardenticatenales bacterium]
MSIPIRELKQRYKIGLALGDLLPTHDRPIPLPLSTGSPLYDAALTDKLVATTTLTEPEHLSRGWHLVRGASRTEQEVLARHARHLLNDYKLLLALHSWEQGEEGLTRTFLGALPWGWRFAFPTAVIKPAAHLFTGWRRALRFRLVEEPRFPALQELFRETLAQAPGVAILKYRRTVQEAAALLHFRFEGERERAIHSLCFENGRNLDAATLEPIGTYLRARDALAHGGAAAMLRVLEQSPHEIPITSFMGLLGNAGLKLSGGAVGERPALRDYAVRCATPVELLLRLNEWGDWLTEAQATALAQKVRERVIERGMDIPFFKVVKAFMNAPPRAKRLLLEPLYIPLLHHFGRQMAGLLPGPAPLSFVQPGNIIHVMSFLLYAVLSSAMETRMILLYHDGVEELPPLPLDEVARHLADDVQSFQSWLLSEFGGLMSQHSYQYDYSAVARTLTRLDPAAPLLL